MMLCSATTLASSSLIAPLNRLETGSREETTRHLSLSVRSDSAGLLALPMSFERLSRGASPDQAGLTAVGVRSNSTLDRTAGSPSLAAAGQRGP